jgi:hypothetical protein
MDGAIVLACMQVAARAGIGLMLAGAGVAFLLFFILSMLDSVAPARSPRLSTGRSGAL